MSQLIKSIEDLQEHIGISSHFDFLKLQPHIGRAERKFIIGMVGREQFADFVAYTDSDMVIKEVKKLLEEATACFGMSLGLPVINSSVTNSGVKSNKNQDTDKAAWYEVKDLIRTYRSTANEALDSALELMENNPDKFPKWVASEQYSIFNDFIVKQTSEFNSGFYIHNNRQTFLALKPYMKEVEEQYLIPFLGDCIDLIKTPSSDKKIKRAQELSRLAVISLSIAKVATTGTFSFTNTGMMVTSEEMPWDKSKAELSETILEKLADARQSSGESFIKKLKEYFLKNAASFPCYEIKTGGSISDKIIKKKSFLMT